MKRRAYLIAGLALAALGAAAAVPTGAWAQGAAPKKVQFLTNYVYNGRHAPFFVGVEKGFFREVGFDVQIAPATGSGFVITAVDGGRADYGMADLSSVVQAIGKGAKVKAFMVYTDVTTNGLASLTPVPTPESIGGRKVGASQTDSVRVILPIVYDARKIDPASINWQTADPGVLASLLMSGQVDMITATSDGDMPALAKVAAQQGKSVQFGSFAEWGYDVFGFVLVGGKAALEQNPEEARRFADATRRAVRYAADNPDETASIMVKANPTMNRDTVLAQWRETVKSMNTPYTAQHGYGTPGTDRVVRSIDLVRRALKVDASVSPDDLFVAAAK